MKCMKCTKFLIYFIIYCFSCFSCSAQYVPSYVSCGLSACDVLSMMRKEIADKRYDTQLLEFKQKMEFVTSIEFKFADISMEFDRMNYEFDVFKEEFSKFQKKQNIKPETLLAKPSTSDTKTSSAERKLEEIEQKLEKYLDQIELINSLKSELASLKKELLKYDNTQQIMIEENAQKVNELQKESFLRFNDIEELRTLLNETQNVQNETNNSFAKILPKFDELHGVKHNIQNKLDAHISNSSARTIDLKQQLEGLSNETKRDIADFKTTVLVYNNESAAQLQDKIQDMAEHVALVEEEVWLLQDSLNATDEKITNEILVDIEKIANFSQQMERVVEENDIKLAELQKHASGHTRRILKLHLDIEDIGERVTTNTLNSKEIETEVKVLIKKVLHLELASKEMSDKLEAAQDTIDELTKSSNWFARDEYNEENTRFSQPSYITSGSTTRASCIFVNYNKDLVASVDGRPITTSVRAVADGKFVYFRCKDPGAYRIHSSLPTQCMDGNWTRNQPTCGALHDIKGNTLIEDTVPAIIIEPRADSDSTGILPNGTFVVRPGTKAIIACHFLISPNKVEMTVKRSSRQEEIVRGKWNDDRTRYENVIIDANNSDHSGAYTCTNEAGVSHIVHVVVETVYCKLPQLGRKLGSVGKMNNVMNSEIQFQCTELNEKLVWPTTDTDDDNSHKIKCLPSGEWSRELPDCQPKAKSLQ